MISDMMLRFWMRRSQSRLHVVENENQSQISHILVPVKIRKGMAEISQSILRARPRTNQWCIFHGATNQSSERLESGWQKSSAINIKTFRRITLCGLKYGHNNQRHNYRRVNDSSCTSSRWLCCIFQQLGLKICTSWNHSSASGKIVGNGNSIWS